MTACPTPSPGWRPPDWYPATHGDVRAWAEMFWGHLLALDETITLMGEEMGQREDAADARQLELIELIRGGITARDAEIAALRAELGNADAEAQARVDAALEADSEFDADKKEAANAALEELAPAAPPAEEPTPEPQQPAEPEAPVDPENPEN